MRVLLALTTVALAAVPAASADRSKDAVAIARATAGRTAGAAVDCITRTRTGGDFQVAGRTLIFKADPRVTYLNQVSPGCDTGLSRQALVFRSNSSRLCQGEIVEAVDPMGSSAGGSCTLGPFTPYTRP